MKRINIAVGLVGILLGAYVIFTASSFPENQSAVDPGAAYFPTLMGVIVVVLCIALIAQSLMGKINDMEQDFKITPGLKRVGLGILLFLVYGILFKILGFILDSIVFCILGMLLLNNRKWIQMTLVSIIVPLVIYAVFDSVLGAKLPSGLLSPIL